MVEASQWYSLISIGSSSLALLAAAYVVRKIPNRRAGDTFVLAMVFFVLAGTFAYLLRTSTLDYGTNSGPLTFARLFYFFHVPPGLVHRDVNPDRAHELAIVNILVGSGVPVVNVDGP